MSNPLTYIKSLVTAKQKSPHEIVMGYLKDVKDFRNNIFVDFILNGKTICQANGRCVGLNKKVARIFLRDDGNYLPSTEEYSSISCFFIVQKNQKQTPCRFTSSVIMTTKTDNSTYIDIKIPSEIINQQRRHNVRVPISKSDIPDFKLWTKKERLGEDNIPKTTWEAVDQDDFEIHNISEGGLMVHITKNEHLTPKLRVGFTFLCTGNFHDAKNQGQNMALIANIVRIAHNEVSSFDTVGLQFSMWRNMGAEQPTWTTVDSGGASFLGTWLIPFKAMPNKKQT